MSEAMELQLSEQQVATDEQQKIIEISQSVAFEDTNSVINFGTECQKKIAEFSDTALAGVKAKDLGQVGTEISSLVTQLKGFKPDEEPKGLAKLFKKSTDSLANMKNKYDTVEGNVNKIVGTLEGHRDQLTRDVVMLDEMYDMNKDYFRELTLYIMGGKQALEEARNGKLVELQEKARETGLAEDAQAASDFAAQCERLEKKIADLETTRAITVQMAPQIRLIQSSDSMMVEKIQTTINNTIPLWKNQMVLALGLAHSKQAVEAQKQVNDLTNELLRKNADTLHQGAVDIAREGERSIVDIETLTYTNQQLIATLDEVLAIQKEGHQKRVDAEAQLAQMESELKDKLLTLAAKPE